jgi:DNA-binding MarR family transcriptional regulator
METKTKEPGEAVRRRRHLSGTVKQALRELRMQLSLLNLRVGALLDLKDVDLDCLDLIAKHGPLSPTALARRAGLHPATMTGILDRLERGGWVVRQRDPSDRRAVVVRARHERNPELIGLYSGMNTAMDEICAAYSDAELQVIADFLNRAARAGHTATDDLAGVQAQAQVLGAVREDLDDRQ